MLKSRETFTSVEAAKIAGVPYKTVDHWARTSLVVPSVAQANGTGTERLYAFRDLVALRLTRELRAGGISIQSIRKVIGFLSHDKKIASPLSETRLLAFGSDVVIVRNCDDVMSLLNRPGQGVFAFFLVVNISLTVTEISKKVKLLRAA